MGPIAKEIENLINSMAHPTGADAPKSTVASPKPAGAAPAAPAADPKAADPAAASEPATNPEPATPTTEAASGGSPDAAAGAEAAPTDAPDAATVQRRDVDPIAAAEPDPTTPDEPTAENAPAPTAPAPSVAASAPAPTVSAPTTPVVSTSTPTTELKPNECVYDDVYCFFADGRFSVYKLRLLLQKATMYQQAVEQMLLAKGKNIEERPTVRVYFNM